MSSLILTTACVLLQTLVLPVEMVLVTTAKFRYVAVCTMEDSVEIAGYFSVRDETSCSFLCSSAMPACQSFVYWKSTSYCSLKDSTVTNMTMTGCPQQSMQVYGEPTTEFLPRDTTKLRCSTGTGCTTSINNFRLCNGGGAGVCDPMQGRLEVYYNGQWGSVCDDGWESTTSPMAVVTCKMFGYSDGLPRWSAFFGAAPSSYPIWLDDVYCSGNEISLDLCSHNTWGSHNCGHGEDVGVVCE